MPRRSVDLLRKRKAGEVALLENWFRRRQHFHIENLTSLHVLMRWALHCTGLTKRGERNARALRVNAYSIVLPNLPRAFDGYRLLHLSDVHIDGVAGLTEALCEHLAGLHADACVFTGDFRYHTSGPCFNVVHHMEKVVRHIHVRDGVYGVLGNHDEYEEVALLEQVGLRMLMNAAVPLRRDGETVWLAGIDDPHYYQCDDVERACEEVPPGACAILLAHSPECYAAAAARGLALYLCGHTHAGQMRIPHLGAPLVHARCPRAFAAGLWRHGGMQGFTNAGAGCSCVPARFGCPPEIALLELHCAPDSPR